RCLVQSRSVVQYMADRRAVRGAGRVVERALSYRLFEQPRHPYTKALVAAVPNPDLDDPPDFQMVMDERASNPAAWPPPFTLDGIQPADLLEVEPGHFVRARKSAKTEELVA